jgi:N6-L-threonylcarbamoyladenine synthase
MTILAFETSCDETAIAAIVANEKEKNVGNFHVLADVTQSQISLHNTWGGVVPSLAKREHAKNILSVLAQCLEKANIKGEGENVILAEDKKEKIKSTFTHLPALAEGLIVFVEKNPLPYIDLITVTVGPGLEPALWVGINTAEALGIAWEKPVLGVNHMEGHILSVLLDKEGAGEFNIKGIKFPVLSLLVSGGHTELVLMESWLNYKVIGQTKDDAAGEAFDKAARMLGLPYPGGPEIAKLALNAKNNPPFALPRPMLHSKDFNFSFSGLKTALLYNLKKIEPVSEEVKSEVAHEFEEAIVEVLVKKTIAAAKEHAVTTVILGGGVSANTRLREELIKEVAGLPDVKLLLPERKYTTDNAVMIAIAGYFKSKDDSSVSPPLIARGNLLLE